MNVPYSMDDSEPDLYGSLGGHSNDDYEYEYTQTKWDGVGFVSPEVKQKINHSPKIYTQEDMTKVIQYNLRAVQRAYNEGYEDGVKDGYIEGNENCQHR